MLWKISSVRDLIISDRGLFNNLIVSFVLVLSQLTTTTNTDLLTN